MRLSPALMAVLSIAAISCATSVNAQTPQPSTKLKTSSARLSVIDASTPANQRVSRSNLQPQPQPTNLVVETIPVSGRGAITPLPKVGFDQKSLPAKALELAQGGTIEQETPNQIQINPSSPAPAAPSPQVPTLPTAPTAPATPVLPPQPETPPSGTQITPPPGGQVAPSPVAPPETTPQTTPETTPTAPSATPPETTPETPPPQPAEPEPRVLVSEVLVLGAEAELQNEVYRVIRTQPGQTTTRSQLQEDINAVFATGFFSNVRATPTDTPLGVRVTFDVTPNPPLQSVRVEGSRVLPEKVVQDIFSPQYGRILNLRDLQNGIQELNKWYQTNGYVLAQVVDVPRVNPDGSVTLQVAEGEVEALQVQFINKEGETQDAQGNPIRGRTRPFIITREFQLKPGDVFNRTTAERDLQRAFGLGIFEDIRLSLQPGQDPRRVIVVANVVERNTGNFGVAGGFSSASGLFGSVSFGQQNFGGNNQKLNAEVQIGQRDQQFDLSFTDPWIAGDEYRTSYTANLFRRRTISLIFDGGDPEIDLPNGDRPRIVRTGGGVSFSRPLSKNPYERSEWNASLGLQYQRVSVRDADGRLSPRDELGNLLSFDPSGKDDLVTAQLAFVRDRRNDFLQPTGGSLLRFSTEQSVPIGSGSLFFNRLRASYSFYVPTRLLKLAPGCRDQQPRIGEEPNREGCPQAFAFNIQGGTVLGDLPPYEAFPLGGTNSVRGYDEGDVGSAKSYLQATAEYRFPLFSIFSGALFLDAATDLGTGNNVPGDPGGVRGKPGSGFGYGVGVRVRSPLGPIRIDFGINDQGGNNIRFGFGERF
ncbi:BamA/TamA family outer membrane protein [Myxacorys almedinensis A]|uniref:BamA/TamA family outer membrane protein n=2 Tax=Myxacorys TaxID=2056239 RepID=A0A8J7Z0X9_9CYAN|nr:BamA/TamA family outer membrane protein [Myxacorys almedinensis A]